MNLASTRDKMGDRRPKGPGVEVERSAEHINSESFARAVAGAMLALRAAPARAGE